MNSQSLLAPKLQLLIFKRSALHCGLPPFLLGDHRNVSPSSPVQSPSWCPLPSGPLEEGTAFLLCCQGDVMRTLRDLTVYLRRARRGLVLSTPWCSTSPRPHAPLLLSSILQRTLSGQLLQFSICSFRSPWSSWSMKASWEIGGSSLHPLYHYIALI